MTDLVLGLDLGGSKTQAPLASLDGNAAPTEFLAGCANLNSVGATEVTRQLRSITDQLPVGDIRTICAGAAGADSPALAGRLAELIRSLAPQADVKVVHDSELILATAGLINGIAVIAGTGSACWGRSADGSTARAGGWGFLLGDGGSGYWVGSQAVRHALAWVDRGTPADRLSQQLAAECDDAAAALVGLIRTVSGKLIGPRLPVVLGGGLLVHQPILTAAVTATLNRRGHDDVRVLTQDPAHGALVLARNVVPS